jgi:hypothetical protein
MPAFVSFVRFGSNPFVAQEGVGRSNFKIGRGGGMIYEARSIGQF